MKRKKLYIIAIAFLVVAGLSMVRVIAENAFDQPNEIPALPSVYYGKVEIGNNPVKDGLKVEAFIDGNNCGQVSETKDGEYVLIVNADSDAFEGCGEEEKEIKILVDGIEADSATWHSGIVRKDDISLEGIAKEDTGDVVGIDRGERRRINRQ